KESEQGQILHMGINEAGSAAAMQVLGTSHAVHGEPMIPVYIFYSMFGFQRTGDQFWAAGDQLARGFIIGATAGKTTWPAREPSTWTATPPCWPRPTRRWSTTTRRTPTRSGTSSGTVCSGCTAARTLGTRTSC